MPRITLLALLSCSLFEVSATFNGLLTADIDVNADGTNDAVSFGFGYTAVGATIRP